MGTIYIEEIKNLFNRIDFPGCEGVLIGDVLHYPIQSLNHFKNIKNINLLSPALWLMRIVYRVLTCKYHYEKTDNSNALFLFSSSYGSRIDHKRGFEAVLSLFKKRSCIIFDNTSNKWSLWKLRYFGLIHDWSKLIKHSDLNLSRLEKAYLLFYLSTVYFDYKDAEYVFGRDFLGIDTLISWCDVHAVDSYFTQKFNLMGKNTVCLQHGSIGDNENHNAWSVKGIKSKCFIADSKFSEDILLRNAYKGKIYVCGYCYNIYKEFKKKNTKSVKKIGVIFSAEGLHDVNTQLCENLKVLNDSGYSFLCKLHPSSKKNDYSEEYLSIFSEIYGSQITSGEFLEKIDMAIICPSTVIYEAIYHQVPFLMISDKDGYYEVYGMPDVITVSDAGDFAEKINRMINGMFDLIYMSLRGYYVAKGNIKENYQKAFHELGIW